MPIAKEKIKSGTVILRCNCIHSYQDEKYGLFMRVMNRKQKDGFRCTVCGKVRDK